MSAVLPVVEAAGGLLFVDHQQLMVVTRLVPHPLQPVCILTNTINSICPHHHINYLK